MLVILIFLAGAGFQVTGQQIVVSSYFNAASYSDEWTELLVNTDNLDLRGWTLGDNNFNQTSWMPAITFNNIPLWANVRAGTIIVVWHRINSSAGPPNPSDLLPGDGYLEVAANDPAFFTGGDFTGNTTLNISNAGDILQLKDAGGNQVHALGHIITPGASWTALTCPKLNHNTASLANNNVLMVIPGIDVTYYGTLIPQAGTTYTATAIAPNFNKGLPNTNATFPNQNSDFWRSLRQPSWTTPSATAVSAAANTQVQLNWSAATDPNPGDGTTGYIILRNTTGAFSTAPLDGHTYTNGDVLGTATVVGHSSTNSFTDNYSLACGSSVYYRIYAYRYAVDDVNGNDFNVARGRAYNEVNYAPASLTAPTAPVAQTMTGNNSYCSNDPNGVAIGLANSEDGVTYQLYINCPAPNTPVGVPIAGVAGTPISFGNQIIPPPGPCTFSVVGTFTAFPACSGNMANTITVSIFPAPTFTITSTDPTTCLGTDGTITLNGLNASTVYQVNYSWNGTPATPQNIPSNTSGSLTITGLPAGNYTNITVTLSGCTSSPATVTLSDPPTPPAPNITASVNPICNGQSTTLSSTTVCNGTLTWSTGATTSSITVSPTVNTDYTATCSENGCVSPVSNTISVIVNDAPVIASVFPSNPTSCGGTDGFISLSGLIPLTTYQVDYLFNGAPVGPLFINSDAGGNLVITGLAAGSYTDIIVTLNGCPSLPSSTSLSDPGAPAAPAVSASQTTICEGQSTDLTATGCAGTITWSNGANTATTTVSPTSTTSYTATCTVSGCTSASSSPITITVNALPLISSVSPNNPSTCGGNDGSIELDLLTPGTMYSVSYSLNGIPVGTQNLSTNASGILTIPGLTAGSYSAIVVSLNGCASLPGNTVLLDPNSPAAPTVDPPATTVCSGQSVILTASGCAGTLLWSTGETSTSITVTPGTTTSYSVTCTVSGCTSPASNLATVTVNTPPAITSIIPTDATNGQPNGSMTATATGTPPLQYSIDGTNWQSGGTFGGIAQGTYTLQVRDGSGCISTAPFTINNVILAGIIMEADTAKACPGSNVTVTFIATGMTDIRSFDLCFTFDPSIAAYNGVSFMNTELVNVITDSSIPGRLHMTWDGAANVTIPNGDIIFRLRFRGIQSGLSAIEWNDFLPGICGVYDETGTAIQFNYTAGAANYLQAPDAVITGDTEVCFGEPITLTALGDTLTHVWTLPDGSLFTGQVYQVLNSALADSGSYRLLTTNTIGCIDKDTVQVNVHEMPQVSLASADSLCAEATYTLSPGAFATYLWQDGSTNPTFTASGEGLFWVQVTDNAGCTGSDSVSLIICPAALLVPNAFSPNYDGHNDRFRARYTDLDGLEDFKMLIYNRWGQLIFESNSIQQGWDGNYTNGEQCPAGLYTYVILFKKPEGKTLSQKSPYRGMVTLVR